MDDNTCNIPEDLWEDITSEGDSWCVDEENFVGHSSQGDWGQFPSITVAMLFAERRL